MTRPIHQEVVFKANPDRVYEALTEAAKFSKVTGGAPAEINTGADGRFSCFGGMISGKNIELIPSQRIVQAWRAGNWAPGVYSIARFELKKQDAGTLLVFDHTGFPEDNREHLEAGWIANYWEPLKKYFA